MWAHRARRLGARDPHVDRFVIEALFTTVTNVNFDPDRLEAILWQGLSLRETARALYEAACADAGEPPEVLHGPAVWTPASSREGLLKQQETLGVLSRRNAQGEDVVGLQELLTYGLKGAAAYADHALILGVEDEEVWAFFHEAMSFLADAPTDVNTLTAMCLRCGQVNYLVMERLDQANTGAYGSPVPTSVRIEPKAGKAILVSGHDLKDLHDLLVQTEGTGINVYTHGEMLPAHGYPKLRSFPHLAGNYGGAWQDQQKEFDAFPGSILMTTNCIQKPRDTYKGRIFTTSLVAWPGVEHVQGPDFARVIEAALAEPGFAEDGPDRSITVGFGHHAVVGIADRVIEAIKTGALRHFFLIGGCDGAKSGRNYYTDLAQAVPDDCVILTLACGKYRFNKREFGEIAGIPRLLDVGQCNDAYSALRIASALADAFGTEINDLPLSLVLSWYEQKAVVILLTLLSLGVKNIRLGPSLPAFVSPAVLRTLVDTFGLQPITTPQQDLAEILSG